MEKEKAQIGTRIRTLTAWSGVPAGTEGVIDEHWLGPGDNPKPLYMIAWDLPDQPLPEGYQIHDGTPAFMSRILRDGFAENELEHLETVNEG